MKSWRPKARAQRQRQGEHHREAGEDRAGDEVGREDRGVPARDDAGREVEGHDRVDRDDERRGQPGEEQRRHLVVVPVARRAAPAHGEHAVDMLREAAAGPVAQRREVGDQADVPEEERDRGVGRDREDVPDQRAAELRPQAHGVGVGQQPVGEPRAAGVEQPDRGRRRPPRRCVIASAKRLIEVRQVWRSSSRIAEISVPAWPMPIHQTKLMMSKPQPTGTLMPQMPMPSEDQVRDRVDPAPSGP